MPANLPPEYKAAEKKFKAASTIAEKIAALEKEVVPQCGVGLRR